MKPRGTATKRLTDVLEVLQLARKSGLLTIERDAVYSNELEQGTITLVNGQITDASYRNYRGAAALKELMTWGACYFVLHAPSTNDDLTSTPSSLPRAAPATPYPTEVGKSALSGWRSPPSTPMAPYRLRQVDEVLPYFNAMGLSRSHRQLFLLIDGQRTTAELMRLMNRGPDEVLALLADLARSGLIRQ